MGDGAGHPLFAKAAAYLIVQGVVLMLLGVLGLAAPVLAGLAVAIFVGFLLIVGGIASAVSAFVTRPHMHFWWSLFSGIIAVIAGLFALVYPKVAVVGLTLVIAVWLAIDGVNSIMLAIEVRRTHGHGVVWLVLAAIVDWVLAALLVFLPPEAAAVALGVIVGVGLLFRGAALTAMGVTLRRKFA